MLVSLAENVGDEVEANAMVDVVALCWSCSGGREKSDECGNDSGGVHVEGDCRVDLAEGLALTELLLEDIRMCSALCEDEECGLKTRASLYKVNDTLFSVSGCDESSEVVINKVRYGKQD